MDNKGQSLYREAKLRIPGGTQLFSKRPELFLPEQWPSYYSQAKGVEVLDLDGNKYIDMSYMGIGACILGYADPEVDKAVKVAIDSGSMCTLNCPEEVELANLLCELHPWAEMVRYARMGGEATTIAVRIARAKTKKDKVVFCGYHGWHDWYLAANLGEKSALDGHLLPGLQPAGVPRCLRNTTFAFHYNKIEELKAITSQYRDEIAVIIMEPLRNYEPEPGFLEEVREIATNINAVLIFDEVSSGWRLTTGGAHLLYEVTPDIAVFGKLAVRDRKFLLDTLVDVLKECVGKNGTIIMPTFTYSFCKGEVFDVDNSKSTVGILTEHFRSLPAVKRTQQPIFSCAVYGKKQEYYLNVSKDSFGKGSIFEKLHKDNGKILFLGADFHACP